MQINQIVVYVKFSASYFPPGDFTTHSYLLKLICLFFLKKQLPLGP
jgi:hypothetical protein